METLELFIRIKDGQPFEHPILGENFRQAFPDVDVNNLPSEFARFERVEPLRPTKVYEVCETTYEWVNGVVKDVHRLRDMNEQEKLNKQNEVKREWAETMFPSWIFNEETCNFYPPVPYPNDGKFYEWSEETTSWVAIQQPE